MKLTTPLGEDVLLIKRLRAEEGLNRLFRFDLEILHDHGTSMSDEPMIAEVPKLLGQPMTVSVLQNDDTVRFFNGICVRFDQGNREGRFTNYRAEVVPQVWLLTQISQSRIFQQKSVLDILHQVFQGFPVDFEVQGTFEQRNYCVQYRESDFAFASRLMEEEGIYYYFEHKAGSHRMIVANKPESHRVCPSRSKLPFHLVVGSEEGWIASVFGWNVVNQLRTGKYTVWDHHFQLPTSHLDAEQLSRFDIGGNQNLEHYDFPGEYAQRFDGIDKGSGDQKSELDKVFEDRRRVAEIRQQEIDVGYKTIKGKSDCCALTGGYRFELENHPAGDNNAFHVLVDVQIEAVQTPFYVSDDIISDPYNVSFSCIPFADDPKKAPFRPNRKTPKPVIQGTQTAVVVGPAGEEIFTDKYGRVKVQFHWDREGRNDAASSCWLRVATSIAGNKWGTMFIPRIGQEVVVDFMEGDPDQPIIVGSVYNPQTMPHYELPKFKTLSYFKSRTSPDDGKGFNEIRFEDKQGKEQVFIHSRKRMDTRVRGSFYETCGGNRQELIGMRSDNKPGGNLAVSVGGNYDLHVKDSMYIGIDGKLNEGVKGDVVEGYDGSQQTVVKSKVEINAREITLEGSQKVVLKVGSSCIIVDMMGIIIQGPMVKINSGGSAPPTSPAIIDDPLDAEAADTGEPGYLDRPRSGGGKGGRNRRTLNGQHAPQVKRNKDGTYQVGKNIKVTGTDEFVGKALNDLSDIYNTPTGKKVMDELDKGKHETTIKELDMATARRNGALAGPASDADAQTKGKGSPTTVSYNPDLKNDFYTDQDGKKHDMPVQATLGHELIHALHSSRGTDRNHIPEASEVGSTEEESQTIGIHGHKNGDNNDGLTQNNMLKEMGKDFQRTDHDRSLVTPK